MLVKSSNKSRKKAAPHSPLAKLWRRASLPVRVLGVCVWLAAAVVAGQLAAGYVFALLGIQLTTVMTMLATVVANAIIIGLVIWTPKLFRRTMLSLRELGLWRAPNWKDIGMTLIGVVGYFILSIVFMLLASALIPGFAIDQKQELGFDPHLKNAVEYVTVFLVLVVVVPIVEETIFRGWLYGMLQKIGLNLVWIIVIVSVLFGVAHGQWNVGVNTAAMAVVACALRDSTGAIWSSIFLHALKNGLAYYMLFVNPTFFSIIGK